nr:hypothetical protein CFP56_41684 [Quercus suber]
MIERSKGQESSLTPAALYISSGSNPDRVTELEPARKTCSMEHPLSPLNLTTMIIRRKVKKHDKRRIDARKRRNRACETIVADIELGQITCELKE